MHKLNRIINIIGKTPFGDVLLQSAPDDRLLANQLRLHFEREIKSKNALSNAGALQGILNARACEVPELGQYEFEANQPVYEIVVILVLARTINRLSGRAFIPGWQRPNQGAIMAAFNDKESWDGFVYEDPGASVDPVSMVPVEVKSTMIRPGMSDEMDPNQQLRASLPGHKKHFQSEGSICCVFVMPYTSRPKLAFDIKEASEEMNKVVSDKAMGAFCLLSFPKVENEGIGIKLNCCLLSKDPKFAANGKIDRVEMTEMYLGLVG